MKISKSKQELARIISENGGWRDGEFAAQDGDGGVGGYGVKPEWDSLAKYWCREASDEWFSANKINNHHQCALSRAEYEHLYPALDADGWIEWNGGECPVEMGAPIDVKFRDGTMQPACDARGEKSPSHRYWTSVWSHSNHHADIIAYRPHKPEQSGATDKLSSEAVSAAKIALMSDSIEELVRKPTIEQLAADYRNKLDYANRKQDEADKANMESDAALSQLEDAIAAIGFAITPLAATEKEPELAITDWRDLQVGDVVKITSVFERGNEDYWDVIGTDAVVIHAGDPARQDLVVSQDDMKFHIDGFRFIRRP